MNLPYPYTGNAYYAYPKYPEYHCSSHNGLTRYYHDGNPESIYSCFIGPEHISTRSIRSATASQLAKNESLLLENDASMSCTQLPYSSSGRSLLPPVSPSSCLSTSQASCTDTVFPMPGPRPLLKDNLTNAIRPYDGLLFNKRATNQNRSLDSFHTSFKNAPMSSPYIPASRDSPETLATAETDFSYHSISNNTQRNLFNQRRKSELYGSVCSSTSEDLYSGRYNLVNT